MVNLISSNNDAVLCSKIDPQYLDLSEQKDFVGLQENFDTLNTFFKGFMDYTYKNDQEIIDNQLNKNKEDINVLTDKLYSLDKKFLRLLHDTNNYTEYTIEAFYQIYHDYYLLIIESLRTQRARYIQDCVNQYLEHASFWDFIFKKRRMEAIEQIYKDAGEQYNKDIQKAVNRYSNFKKIWEKYKSATKNPNKEIKKEEHTDGT